MNKTISTILLTGAICFPFCISAENNQTTGKEILYDKKYKGNVGNTRPNAPSRLLIECEYGRGFIQLMVPFEFSEMQVTISAGSFPVWTDIMTPERSYFDIPILEGEYTIECAADDAHSFVGTLLF